MQSPMKAWSNVCAGWETVDSNKKNAKNKKKNNDSMENDEKLQKNKKHSENDSKGNDPSKMKSVVESKTEIVENDSPVFLSFGDFDSVIVEEFSSCVESESTSLSTTPPRVPACTTTNESDNIMSGMTETEISEDKVDGTIAPATLNSVYPCTKELFRDISLSFIEKMSASVKLNNSGEINTESEAESSMEASKLEGSELNIVDIRMNSRYRRC